ncbi:MAG: hypothetical protein JW909_03390 [Planctomycetes bacterium]|nr:hypothetical protein [Planctomycetota bacterium]
MCGKSFAGVVFFVLSVLSLPCRITAGEQAPERKDWEKRWVYLPHNLYVDDNMPKIQAIIERSSRCGYNGVLFADYKMFTWWKLDNADRWKKNARRLRAMTRDLGMELNVCVLPFGYASSLLFHDQNLASGMPVKGAPLTAVNGVLVPDRTADIPNGSFEEHNGDRVLRVAFQDNPGETSFIDKDVHRDGECSLRFENVGRVNRHGHGRVCWKIGVKPWQQYRIRAWMKTEKLSASEMKILVLGGNRTLQHQYLCVGQGTRLSHVNNARDLTTDWVEQKVTFNSLDNKEVLIYAGIWGGTTGKIWWDGVRIDSVPTLNLLRRNSLPLVVLAEDGRKLEEGVDLERVVDPLLGCTPWPGSFETSHEPPRIRLLKTASVPVRDGDKLSISCYHTVLVHGAQANCSMDDPAVFDLCRTEMQKTREALDPDGYFMSHDEIRVAGWEPEQVKRFKTSGELFAFNIKTCSDIAFKYAAGKPVFVWSDMFDPHHNAHAGYYLVNNTIEGSWEGLPPEVIVMKWGGGDRARPGLEFFSRRGHKQMLAAYYDSDVVADYRMWDTAARDVPGVIGTMYTTWANDYRALERFARTWWGQNETPPAQEKP